MSDPQPESAGEPRPEPPKEGPVRGGGRPREPASPKPPAPAWNAADPDATIVSLDDDLERDPMLSSLVAAIAEPVEPPPTVRTRLLTEFRMSMVGPGLEPAPRKFGGWALVPWALAAMLAAVAGIGWNALYTNQSQIVEMRSAIAQLQGQQLDARMLAESRLAHLEPSTPTADRRRGVLAWSPQGTWHLWVMLPPLDGDQVYQAWFITKDGEAISAGLLNQQGEVYSLEVPVPDELKGRINATGITAEPPGGSKAPTLPILLQGAI